METIRIFDTTLRDGEQSPGCSMSAKEKLLLARQLDRLGEEVIEAGFAASSPGDFESVRQIGQQINRAKVVSLCRASISDIERAVDAGTNGFLTKPVNRIELVKRVENMLALKGMTDENERLRQYIQRVEEGT